MGATALGGLWAWHICETNLRCGQGYAIFNLKSQFSIFDSFQDIQTCGANRATESKSEIRILCLL